MNISTQTKFVKDGYGTGFSAGLTMINSQTMENFAKISETDSETVFEHRNGPVMTLYKKNINGATRVHTEIVNRSSEPVILEMISTLVLEGIEADMIHRLQSFWSAEGKLRSESIFDLHLEKSWNRCGMRIEKFGNTGSMPVRKYVPFVALENTKTGHFIGLQLYQASSWQIELLVKNDDSFTINAGLADRDFGHWKKTLAPGETFTTPEAVYAEGTSLLEVCDKLVKAQSPDIAEVDKDLPVIFNEYCTTWGNPSFDNVARIADKLCGKGIRYLVIDSGWYGHGNWWDQIGDWEVNEDRFAGGMKAIADHIRQKGMIPGLWFEFEYLAHACKYFDAAEHLVKKDGVPLTISGRRLWDMEDPWVIDYLTEKVIRLLKDCGFGYLKVDYNDTMGIGCDDPDGFGEGLRKKVLATQRFFKKIKEEIPGIVIENCSSGGHRLVPSMMEICSQASFSDAHEIKSIPLIAANVQMWIKPSQSQIWAVMRAKDDDARIYYSLCNTFLGRMCLSGDIYDLSDHQWELIQKGMDFYSLAKEIIRSGATVYRTFNTKSYENPTGEQLVIREYNGRSLAIFHRFQSSSDIDLSFLDGHRVIATFGKADTDFSAMAWIYE